MSKETSHGPRSTGLDQLVRRLDAADRLPFVADLRRRSYDLLDVRDGVPILDVGCGTGCAVAELAELGARPIGVDVSRSVLTEARSRHPRLDLRVGDAYQLPLEDGAVCGYRADKVFHELDEPALALAEARRVLAPGGRVVLIGQDWDSFIIDSDDGGLTRTIVHARADTVRRPRAARQFRNLLLDAGFQAPVVEVRTGVFTDTTMLPMLVGLADAASAAGAVTGEQAERWIADQRRRAGNGRFFLALPMFVASARRA